MRVGVDSYSYHRFFGELRHGERPAAIHWSDGVGDVVDEIATLGLSVASLETCFMPGPDERTADSIARANERLEVVLAWGAPEGIRYGTDPEALADLQAWVELAGSAGLESMRIVLGGPRLRGMAATNRESTVEALTTAASAARSGGVSLAIENHGDITAADLCDIVEQVNDERVGVCFDTANALRVGDDVVAAAELLARHVQIVHLKDIEDPASERDPVAGPCSVAYGSGVVPLAETLTALGRGGFDGLVCIELGQIPADGDERSLTRSGIEWLARFAQTTSA